MKKHCLSILIPILAVITVHARLGESIRECDQRYGKRIKSTLTTNGTGFIQYRKNDLNISVHFIKGSADLICYKSGEFIKMTYPLADRLVKINARNKTMELTTKVEIIDYEEFTGEKIIIPVDPVKWKSTDGRILASFSPGKGILEIKAATHDNLLIEQTLEGL